eukprot:11513086-Alexandrium_andersonii.AAC.1
MDSVDATLSGQWAQWTQCSVGSALSGLSGLSAEWAHVSARWWHQLHRHAESSDRSPRPQSA